jgi:hypothetical protein
MSVSAATFTGERVQGALRREFPDVSEVLVHIKPHFTYTKGDLESMAATLEASKAPGLTVRGSKLLTSHITEFESDSAC